MSRTTNYIGLPEEAKEFLKSVDAKKLTSYIGTHGIAGENVYFIIYEYAGRCSV